MIREDWLLSVVKKIRPDFERAGFPLPDKIRASCSWPSKSALARKSKRVGEAWSADCSGDKTFETFVSPVLQDSVEVAAVLVHELCHCAVGLKAKHGPKFRACAVAMGLEGKMTATHAGEKLKARLGTIIAKIGPYPHASLKHSNAPPTQTTRMRKIACPDCGYSARTTRKWLEVGVPTCCCGAAMQAEDNED